MRSFVLVCLFALFAVASVSALHADVASLMNEDGVEYVFAEEVSSLETRTSAGFPITAAQLAAATGMSASTAATWLAPIQAAANAYDISNAKRMAAFLGQCGHESGGFTTFVENLNYKAAGLVATWPSRFTSKTAPAYANNPTKIANKVYADRNGNGNEASGDGFKYRGRGLIQLTGKSNYQAFGKAVGKDFVSTPDLIAQPNWAALSAAWFWSNNGLNSKADANQITAIGAVINGSNPPKGAADRTARTTKATRALAPAPTVKSTGKKTTTAAKKTTAKKTTKRFF